MKYATFDADGFPVAFYSEDVQGVRVLPTYGDRPIIGYTTPEDGGDPEPIYGQAPVVGYKDNPDTLIPANAIEISDTQWSDFISNPGMRRWVSGAVVSYVPAQPDPGPYRIAKTTPWLRMTDDEAATMDAVMSETSARLKQIYMAATYLSSDDSLWGTLHQLLANQLGTARADELLAPET